MAGLRVFVSSTCYDLSMVRSQLRLFINSIGYEPIMSDYNDVLYDPRIHTHTSCVDEVINCDMVVLIIGSRFGGKGEIEAFSRINFEKIQKDNSCVDVLKKSDKISVTQLEVLKAIEESIPVYTFIDNKVWHDHELYEKNKEKQIVDQIIFPSIEKQDTAKYIFDFINFVRLRTKGNNIFTFTKIQDIEDTLRKQWSNYFQRLLNEQKHKANEIKQIDYLSEQFEDLKAAILTSIGTSNEKEVARGIIKYRHLIDFVKGLRLDIDYLRESNQRWDDLLKYAGIAEIIDSRELSANVQLDDNRINRMRPRTFLIKEDGTFFEYRFLKERLYDLSFEWDSFTQLHSETRRIIIDALLEMSSGMPYLRYCNRDFKSELIYADEIVAGSIKNENN